MGMRNSSIRCTNCSWLSSRMRRCSASWRASYSASTSRTAWSIGPPRHSAVLFSEYSFDALHRLVEHFTNAYLCFRSELTTAGCTLERLEETPGLPHQIAEVFELALPGCIVEAAVEVRHFVAMRFEIGAAFVGDRVDLAAFAFVQLGVAHLLEQLERGVDHAWARTVCAAAALFDGLDDLVPMPLALGEHVQHEVTNAAALCAWRRTEEVCEPVRAAAHAVPTPEGSARAERAPWAGPVAPALLRVVASVLPGVVPVVMMIVGP